MAATKKIIIDTDPGIDDAMAIFVVLRSPQVEVIGVTTIYGKVYTTLATRDALHLLEVAGRADIPVAERKDAKLRIVDFVHGTDGLGNQNFPPPKGKPIEQSAATFLIEQANLYLGKLLSKLCQKDWQSVLLDETFSVNDDMNPAAEANIFGDPDAADIVFTSGADVLAVGINVTHQVVLTDADREISWFNQMERFAQYLSRILEVYFSYHREANLTRGVYLHEPTAILASINPSLVTFTEGLVSVQTTGITRGLTILYNGQKRFSEHTEWSDKSTVKVAVTVDSPSVVKLVLDRLMGS
ncbi:hypothetical protein ACJRO7_000272 [Eucalyptus globulus]|uniref:Inosine/uridine-preferring nucleoside hydrolase domain-containing protein n=1 Tax=Eucalyptus globulus TaxID=34317 RepID=A0ABD3LM57_EUCGL